MIDKILDMFPARNWIFDVKGGKIKPHKNGKLFAKKAIKGKQLKNRSAKKQKISKPKLLKKQDKRISH